MPLRLHRQEIENLSGDPSSTMKRHDERGRLCRIKPGRHQEGAVPPAVQIQRVAARCCRGGRGDLLRARPENT